MIGAANEGIMRLSTQGPVQRIEGPLYIPFMTLHKARMLRQKARKHRLPLPMHAALAIVLESQLRGSEKRSGRVQIDRDLAAEIESLKGGKSFTETVNQILADALQLANAKAVQK